MHIPSVQKIEKQARLYANSNYVSAPGWAEEYRIANESYTALRNRWDRQVLSKCPQWNGTSNKCTCSEGHDQLRADLAAATELVNRLHRANADAFKQVYETRKSELLRMAAAKNKWRSRNL